MKKGNVKWSKEQKYNVLINLAFITQRNSVNLDDSDQNINKPLITVRTPTRGRTTTTPVKTYVMWAMLVCRYLEIC